MLDLNIDSLSSEGEGIGSLDGLKIFVDYALPSECVSIDIFEKKQNYAKAHLKTIHTPSPHRIPPPCPFFGECGGCTLMHLSYEQQLVHKQKRVQDSLKRIAKLDVPVLECIASPLLLGYRNKIQMPIVWEGHKKKIGLYKKGTHEVIAVDRCLIQCSQGEEVLKFVSEKITLESIRYLLIRNALSTQEALVVLVTDGRFPEETKRFGESLLAHPLIKGVVENIHPHATNTILSNTFRHLAGASSIHEKLLGHFFKISPSSFFQVNPLQAENVYKKALECAAIDSQTRVLDAYCGVGTLALLAASQARYVYGIECIPDAIRDAQENAHLNQISNCQFFCGPVEKLIHKIGPLDCVILNPPRKGCAPELIATLLKKLPPRIVYISCDPATLARDLGLLSSHYKIDLVQPFDMFPQTMHIETVVKLTRVE